MKPIVRDLFNVLLSCNFEGTIIEAVREDTHKIEIELLLPYHQEVADLEDLLPNICQEFNCSDYEIVQRLGKKVRVLFGKRDLDGILFNNKYIRENTLQIELPTSFDSHILDFEDGASCHMLNGGAPRMGKTMFLLYMSTLLYIQNKGKIDLILSSVKLKDFYPLLDLPNVQTAKDETEFTLVLDGLINEYKKRNELLYTPEFQKATDAKSVRKYYPSKYHLFRPIVIVIDEYAEYSKYPHINKMVSELVRVAGYVNVHVIISTQRPDARQTLPPDIKMGLMTRICFQTADENNSIVILDEAGAEKLPNKQGRAILRDGKSYIVQVPKMEYETAEELLKPYKREIEKNEQSSNEEIQGRANNNLLDSIQSRFEKSNCSVVFSKEYTSGQCMQQNNETPVDGWFRLADTKGKG